jgi:hypothetical protein
MEEQEKETVTLPEAQVAQPPAQPSSQPNLPIGWSYNNQKSFENVRKARAVANMKHGMYSGVPIVCQGAKCPFRDTCWIPDAELEVGGRCPIEVGAILERFDAYVKEWSVEDDDTTDHSIIKDIIDIEIMMLRADNSLAISGDFINEVVAGTDDQGRPIKRPELHQAFEAKARLRSERIKLLNQMNSTRKDRKQEVAGLTDPSSIASSLMQKMRALQNSGKIIDVTPTDEQDGVKDGETLPAEVK